MVHTGTINDLINAHFQMKSSYLINAPSTLFKLYWMPLSNKRPPLGITPKYEELANRSKISQFFQFLA